jgi:ubiquinone/menaquinone biosynthesis C-methylase UbiE
MNHTGPLTKAELTDFAAGFSRLNNSSDLYRAGDLEKGKIKRSINTFYDRLAGTPVGREFWNWGMFAPEIDAQIRETIGDYQGEASDGFSEQLYYYAINKVPVQDYSGLVVLEVGCGMGEGLNFLSRVVDGADFVGLDLSNVAVERANSMFARKHLNFTQGDAEHLPFNDGTIDLVINIESSHNYPNISKFFSESVRVLKRGGYFACADVFTSVRRDLFKQLTRQSSALTWMIEEDISQCVKAAINRRLEPGSVAMRHFAEQWTYLERLILTPGYARFLGAEFVGYRPNLISGFLNWVAMPSMPSLEIESYWFHMARKE